HFFFSSRRRHTRWPRDWSSDVCSSDLECHAPARARRSHAHSKTCAETSPFRASFPRSFCGCGLRRGARRPGSLWWSGEQEVYLRSEERRVGKECRYGWSECRKEIGDAV